MSLHTPARVREDISEAARATGRRIRELLPQRADLAAMRRNPGRNVLAGVTVGIVALPLALAFGITSGMGAAAGLATAIIAGMLAAFFGGSNIQVSGPTGAMTVVLVPIIATHGANGVLVVGLMAGVLLLIMAFTRLGRFIRFIPLPVIEGFTLGIAIIIALQQIPNALGVTSHGEKVVAVAIDGVAQWLHSPDWWAVGICFGVAAVMLLAARWRPTLPISLLAVIGATLLAQFAHLDIARIGALPSGLPIPHVPSINMTDLRVLFAPALAVAALAALESLLSATVADAMTVSEHHDPDRELFGQGVANLAVPMFGGIPATAAIARTAVNARSGATSRLAAITHSLLLLVVVLALAPLVGVIPLAALAGVLLATAIRMVEVSSVRALLGASRGDAAVLVVTTIATVALDLVTAVIVGMLVAAVLALRQVAKSVTLEETPLAAPGDASAEEKLLDHHIVAYRLDGPLFFAGAHQALLEMAEVTDVRVVILRMSRVAALDATGAAVLRDAIEQLERRGITVLLSGVPDHHSPMLEALGVFDSLGAAEHLFDTTPAAIEHARMHVARTPHGAHDPAT